MEIKGIYHLTKKRNERTGLTFFAIKSGDVITYCSGVIPSYPKGIGLKLTGEYEENGYFIAETCNIEQYDTSTTIDFICSSTFMGTGPFVADEIMRKTDLDPYAYVKNSDTIDTGKFKKAEYPVIERLRHYYNFEVLFDFIISYVGTYKDAKYIFEHYGKENAKNNLLRNPYILVNSKTEFSLCEHIAKDAGIKEYDKRRTEAIVYYAMNANSQNGNTYTDFHGLCRLVARIENMAGCGYHTDPLFIAEEILSDKYIIDKQYEGYRIFLKTDYNTEIKVADHIKRLNDGAIDFCSIEPYLISVVEKNSNIEYSLDQKRVFNCLGKTGIKLITGGPGTGKTTLLNGILEYSKIEHPDAPVHLCAPTGCAARRMTESTGIKALTIHKMLDFKPYENVFAASREKLSGIIVVDEGSMVDMYIFYLLLSSIETGSLVIIMGDPNQLPPVGSGNVFKDLLECGHIEKYRLKTIFRQSGRDSIISNSYKIISGRNDFEKDDNFTVIRYDTDDELLKATQEYAKKFEEEDASYKIYTSCRKNKFKTSTININKLLQKESGESSFEYGFNTFSVGDKIIFCRNNYKTNYYNGQEGVITFIQNHSNDHFVTIRTDDDDEITINGDDLDDIELSYALTAHKAQGGECDNALIVISKEPTNMLKRQLLYVEVTRARKNVVILTERNSLEICISSYGEYGRKTQLKDQLVKKLLQFV